MKCKYCHQPAGLFSSKHKECEQKHLSSIDAIKKDLLDRLSISSQIEYTVFEHELSVTISSGYISDSDFENSVFEATIQFLQKKITSVDGICIKNFLFSLPRELKNRITSTDSYKEFWTVFFKEKYLSLTDKEDISKCKVLLYEIKNDNSKNNRAVSKSIDKGLVSILEERITNYLSDGVLDDEEENNVEQFIKNSTLDGTETLNESNAYQKLIQSLILRDIQEGKKVDRCRIDGLPILLGKQEQVLWVFKNVKGYEEKTGRKYVGASRGVSMKICKGVYYRVGASKGHSVDYQYQNELGKGIFIITNKNIYFIGEKQVKLAISKILSFKPYSDGIVLVKDGTNPKPYTFIGFDSWFIVNAMHMLAE